MHRYQCKATRIMNNQGNRTPRKEINKILNTNPKEMDIYDLSKKECRTILLKKFSKHKKAQRDN